MKNKIIVIAFLQNLPESKYDQFNEAFALYRKSENKSIASESSYNRAGYSENGLQNLLYDLQKAYDISDTEKANAIDVNEIEVFDEMPVLGFVPNISDENKISEDEKPIRDEFPFLNEKDCPAEMYVVVGQRIRVYKEYQKLHAQLQDATSENTGGLDEKQIGELTASVEQAYNENQALWKELKYFQDNGKVLGDNPVLSEMRIKKEVDSMTTEKLVKYRQSSATYFSKKKLEIEKAKGDEAKIEKINKGIALRNFQLDLVNAKLNIGDK